MSKCLIQDFDRPLEYVSIIHLLVNTILLHSCKASKICLLSSHFSLYYKPVIIDFKFMFLENSRSIEWLTHCRLGFRIAYTIVLIRKQSTVTFSRCYPDKLKMRCCKILDDPIIIKLVSALNTTCKQRP